MEAVNVTSIKPFETEFNKPEAAKSVLDPSTIAVKANMDQVTAKIYLQKDIFPKLEQALNIVSYTIIN